MSDVFVALLGEIRPNRRLFKILKRMLNDNLRYSPATLKEKRQTDFQLRFGVQFKSYYVLSI